MKTFKLLLFYLAAISSTLFFARCSLTEDVAKITNSLDSLQISIGTPEFKTGIHVEFVDAKTNEPISDKDVSVTITGRDAAYVYNNIGSKQATYSSNWGMLDLVIDPHQVDSVRMKTEPLQFELNATATGYISQSKDISIFDPVRNQIVVPMINLNNLPEGIEVLSKNNVATISGNGEIIEDINIDFGATSPSSLKKMNSFINRNYTTAALLIPKGTILLGRKGQTLTGSLSISCNIEKFPENKNYSENISPFYSNSFKQTMWYQKYGSVEWSMYVGTNEVVGFKNGVAKSYLYLPAAFINPTTNQPIKENEFVKRKVMRKLTSNDVAVDYAINSKVEKDLVLVDTLKNIESLQYQSWYFSWGHYVPTCTNQLVFEFIGENMYNTQNIVFKHKIYKDQKLIDGSIGGIYYFKNGYVNTRRLTNLPEGRTDHLFDDYYTNKDYNLIFTPSGFTIDNSCENKIYKVKVQDVPKQGVEYVNVNLSISLATKSILIKPNLFIIYRALSEKNNYRYLELTNGIGTFKLKVGEKYMVGSSIGNTKAEGQIQIEKANETSYKITITPLAFGSSSGSTPIIEIKPRTIDKTVDISFSASVSDDTINLFK